MTVEIYIQSIESEGVQDRLLKTRQLICKAIPEVSESIAYGLPAYKYKKKPLVYFGAFANHIGFYATPSANENFQDDLKGYKQGRGSIQFRHDRELPLELMEKIILFKKNEIDLK
ncbi:MAG: iron chaperone [Chitinophagales bacterium]|nr:DUF1801 domain-containing protein [Sphingobacteriales bacterium]